MLLNLVMDFIAGELPPHMLLLQFLYSLIALLLVFPVHEFAHGFVAHLMGDDTAKYQGRLTLNPLAHIDLFGFLLLLFFGFGWAKPVQIDSRYFKNRRLGTICTAAAGPLSNVIFCFITYLIYGILMSISVQHGIVWLGVLSLLFLYMATYNATFAVFNLIPVPPLDGSKILGEMLPLKLRFQYYNLERYSSFIFIALIIVMNRTGFVSILSEGLLALFTPIVYAITGGLMG